MTDTHTPGAAGAATGATAGPGRPVTLDVDTTNLKITNLRVAAAVLRSAEAGLPVPDAAGTAALNLPDVGPPTTLLYITANGQTPTRRPAGPWMLFCLTGQARIVIGEIGSGDSYRVMPGDLCQIAAGTPWTVHGLTDTALLTIHTAPASTAPPAADAAVAGA